MTTYTATVRTVYFVRPVDESGPIKIGCSTNPETRRAQLQTAAQRPLEIAATIPGSMDDERRIHSLFWHDHTGGEWFNWSPLLQLVVDAAGRGELDVSALPPKRILRSSRKRLPWTEDQKLRAKLGRMVAKAEKVSGRRFPHYVSHVQFNDTWKELIPEIERFVEESA